MSLVPYPVTFPLLKHFIFHHEAALVVEVTCNRWHKCQSDIHKISWCAMAKNVENLSSKKVSNLVLMGKTCFPCSNSPLIITRVWWQLNESACQNTVGLPSQKSHLAKHITDARQCCMNRGTNRGRLKQKQRGHWFYNKEEDTMVAHEWLWIQESNFYCDRIFKLMPRWDKCINCMEITLKK
jgi:hypothetical protein